MVKGSHFFYFIQMSVIFFCCQTMRCLKECDMIITVKNDLFFVKTKGTFQLFELRAHGKNILIYQYVHSQKSGECSSKLQKAIWSVPQAMCRTESTVCSRFFIHVPTLNAHMKTTANYNGFSKTQVNIGDFGFVLFISFVENETFTSNCSNSELVKAFSLGVIPKKEKVFSMQFKNGASLMQGVDEIINPPGFSR